MPQALLDVAVRHQSHFERLKSGEVQTFDQFLQRLAKAISAKLAVSDLTAFTRTRLETQLKQIRALMVGTLDDYRAVWAASIEEAALYEAGFEIKTLKSVVDGVSFTMPSDKQIIAAAFGTPLGEMQNISGGQMLGGLFDDMSERTIKRVEGAIRVGYVQGETTPQIVRRIVGSKAAKYSDGILAIARRDAETMTRTALQHVSAQARQAVWAENETVVKKVRIVATLDSRTSAICRTLDGQEYPLDKGPRPPFHPNCRTTTVAVLADKFAFLSEGRTRAARDPKSGEVESVSAGSSYYEWLKQQPKGVQDSILGPKRGALLRDGGISAERFAELQLGKNFEPLTLNEMRKLEPFAFERAGL